jgi:hypothetical protein
VSTLSQICVKNPCLVGAFRTCVSAAVSRFPTFYEGLPISRQSRYAHFARLAFMINTRARAQGFCLCTMLARVLVYKNGAHEGAADAQDRTGKPP